MDFALTPDQLALVGLASQILPTRASASGADAPKLWEELARADLLGVGVCESWGGVGGGEVELCLLLEACGRAVLQAPVLETAVAAMAVERFGSEEQQRRWLPELTAGTAMSLSLDDAAGSLTARRGAGQWVLDGTRPRVSYVGQASRILLAARQEGTAECVVLLVDPTAAGVEVTTDPTTSGLSEATLKLTGVGVGTGEVLGTSNGAEIRDWLNDRAVVGTCALQVGIASGALASTAEYVNVREQFGRPLATFQAVAMHAADAYIDTEAMRLTTWQAAWRLAVGRDAAREIDIAKFWAGEGCHRVTSVAHQLHGGIGVTIEYPLHRYLLWGRQLALSYGSGEAHLAALADRVGTHADGSVTIAGTSQGTS